jgi:hypothetical protein
MLRDKKVPLAVAVGPVASAYGIKPAKLKQAYCGTLPWYKKAKEKRALYRNLSKRAASLDIVSLPDDKYLRSIVALFVNENGNPEPLISLEERGELHPEAMPHYIDMLERKLPWSRRPSFLSSETIADLLSQLDEKTPWAEAVRAVALDYRMPH